MKKIILSMLALGLSTAVYAKGSTDDASSEYVPVNELTSRLMPGSTLIKASEANETILKLIGFPKGFKKTVIGTGSRLQNEYVRAGLSGCSVKVTQIIDAKKGLLSSEITVRSNPDDVWAESSFLAYDPDDDTSPNLPIESLRENNVLSFGYHIKGVDADEGPYEAASKLSIDGKKITAWGIGMGLDDAKGKSNACLLK